MDLGIIMGYIAFLLGLYVVLPKLVLLFRTLRRCFCMKRKNLKATYSQGNSYVLITGCTSGIGESMAQKFAREGFNLVLVSRNL